MSALPAPERDPAERAWELITSLFAERKSHFPEIAGRFGLNPGAMHALLSIDPESPQSMSGLANAWRCDASNVTWLVDRLEERGLVERRPHPRDRRVKSVVLPAEGVAVKQRLVEKLSEPPTDLVALDREALEQLRAALEHLPAHPPFWAPTPGDACPMEDAV